MPSSAVEIPASPMIQLVTSIMIPEPRNSVPEATRDDSDWFMDWPMVSTSLVTRESTSPVERESR